MMTPDTLRRLALSFPETTEEPHFEKTSFRVKKKIFATCDSTNMEACIKLSATDQDIFTLAGKSAICPVGNSWGRQGWTMVELEKVDADLFTDALTAAYCEVAPKRLAEQVRPDGSVQ